MHIRKYQPSDYKKVADLFQETVHSVCINEYNQKELAAWAPIPLDYDRWQKRLAKKLPFLAIIENKIVGFAEIENDGHIDCFYVHKDHQRQGVGTFLLNHLYKVTQNQQKLYAEVSITAKPFFLKHGFKVIRKNIVHANNQELSTSVILPFSFIVCFKSNGP